MGTYALVGGSRGIGAARRDRLLSDGHSLSICCRDPLALPADGSITGMTWDAADPDAPAPELPERLDGVVYCPGSIDLTPFQRLRESDFRRAWELNLLGAVRFLQAARRGLLAAERSAVVLFSTVAVQTGLPLHASIASAKGAVEGLVRSLAAEWAPRVRVNAVAPSLTDTPLARDLLTDERRRTHLARQNPLQRIGDPTAVAALVEHLLLAPGSWITGQVVACDGGYGRLRT
ncbi:MAG: SDR family NAD(P)-dependent oxidoreductase [Planctomycetota bacterium]